MERFKKIVSAVVVALFLVNSVVLADNLAPESRLAPLTNPQLLDVMKLTAEIVNVTKKHPDLNKVPRNTVHQIVIDNLSKGDGERLGFYFRSHRLFNSGNTIVIPCSISTLQNGLVVNGRDYICCATKKADGTYDFAFSTMADWEGRTILTAVSDERLLEGLAKKTRSPEEDAGIARFVEQQNETDTVIREAVMSGTVHRLVSNHLMTGYARNFIGHYLGNTTLHDQFTRLIDLGQVMDVSGLKRSHAGGIGLYLAGEGHATKRLMSAIAAKCGLSADDCKRLGKIFDWYVNASIHVPGRPQPWQRGIHKPEDEAAIEKFKTASFANRFDDPQNVVYYPETGEVAPAGRTSASGATFDKRVREAIQIHEEHFSAKPEAAAQGPGRVNLLGEHTDYAGGHVLPIALDGMNVITMVSRRTDRKIVLYSPRFDKTYSITLDELAGISPDRDAGKTAIPEEYAWARYPLGVIRQLIFTGVVFEKGLNISYDGNVPLGGGLSSSAAVETSVFTAVEDIYISKYLNPYMHMHRRDAAVLCRMAEHWTGNHCGIMDQYVAFHGKKGQAVLLDCAEAMKKPEEGGREAHQYIDISFLETAGYKIVTVDTGLPKTDLSWKTYNTRLDELNRAVKVLQRLADKNPDLIRVGSIEEIALKVSPELLEWAKAEIIKEAGEPVYNRIKHVVEEEGRVRRLEGIAERGNRLAADVRQGVRGLKKALDKCVKEFGECLFAGHESLRQLYEVSSRELDTLVQVAKNNGSVGSRLTGAGFVGCTVNIVKAKDLIKFGQNVKNEYNVQFPGATRPEISVSSAGDAAGMIDLAKYESARQSPSGDLVDKTTIDLAAQEIQKTDAVFFVSQSVMTKARCKALAKEFGGAKFVAFNQYDMENLPRLLEQYETAKKAVITAGLKYEDIHNVFARNETLFKGVMLMNISQEGLTETRQERGFQKRVLAVALLARALPEKNYVGTKSYTTLRALLKYMLPSGMTPEDYIQILVNYETPNPYVRLSHLITTLLKPIVPIDAATPVQAVVDTLIAA